MLRHKGSHKTKLCCDKKFLCRDIAGEVLEEECHDIPYSVATLIKANGSETLSRHSLLCYNIKELKIADELYRDRKWQSYKTS